MAFAITIKFLVASIQKSFASSFMSLIKVPIIFRESLSRSVLGRRVFNLIPISASFLIFGESISVFKWIGIILGFTSVILMLYKSNRTVKSNSIYLGFVFLGYGIIDVLFKQIAIQKTQPFTTYLFFIFIGCFFTSLIVSIFFKKTKFEVNKKIFLYGLILGCLNFSNIYFYLNAHKIYNDQPSTVFAVMNFGVISLATVLGVFIFKEKLSKKNIIGIILAVFAIIFVLYSQYKNI